LYDTRKKHLRPDSFYEQKDSFCSFIFSNGKADSGRDAFFLQLNERKHVDSAGGHLNNMPDGKRVEDKMKFLESYRFNIAFEPTRMNGYITEKITDAFAGGAIPIYSGGNGIEKDFNPKAMIDVSRFSSLEECIDYILYVDSHPEEYMKIIREPAFAKDNSLDREYEQKILDFAHSIFDRESIPVLRSTYWDRPKGSEQKESALTASLNK
ncbi:MAG: hypothetical protein J6D18_02320, partial [Erysipelotrichaceae bacterium]|nr:hypothetical protein [Erysipelotrichaceae bacterium]